MAATGISHLLFATIKKVVACLRTRVQCPI